MPATAKALMPFPSELYRQAADHTTNQETTMHQSTPRTEYTLNLDKCWVVEDILAWLALCKNKTKLFKKVFIVGEPV